MSRQVRIDLHSGARVSFGAEPQMTSTHVAEIRIADEGGKVSGSRKPDVRFFGDSRSEVLRQLAVWIENRDDPDFLTMADEYAKAVKP